MSEFIGSRISLISKSDIRYAGTLHDINSENSTVALENVTSFGTEGRRGSPAEEVPASDQVYEYIVFRGSDVKDLRIEEPPKEDNPPPPPQMPDDPAILGASRPSTQNIPSQPQHSAQGPRQQQPPYGGLPHFPYQHYGQYPQARFGGPQGGPGLGFQGAPGSGYPGMPPYGAPPGWFPPGHGFNGPPGPFPPHHQGPSNAGLGPQQGPQQGLPQHQQQNHQQQRGPPVKPGTPSSVQPNNAQAAATNVSAPDTKNKLMAAPEAPSSAPPATATPSAPPLESKPDGQALTPASGTPPPPISSKPTPTGPKSTRIVPAVPLQPRSVQKPTSILPRANPSTAVQAQSSGPKAGDAAATAARQYQNAAQAAAAAVAAAMAKLPPITGQMQQNNDPMDNLTKQVNEMRTDDRIRHSRQPGAGGFAPGHRGGRGGRRGGREPQQDRGLEVPTTDFDFASANAQFKKQDVVKEAIASGSPLGSPVDREVAGSNGNGDIDGAADVVIPAAAGASYNKSSFFDNISSEQKDREDSTDVTRGRGGIFRNEERRRNLETFGMSSVDGGIRGGFRGRGRGRGNLRGGYSREGGAPRGAYRGNREGGDVAVTAAQ